MLTATLHVHVPPCTMHVMMYSSLNRKLCIRVHLHVHVHVAWNIINNLAFNHCGLSRQPLTEIKQPQHHTQPQAVEEPDAGDIKPLTEEEKRQKVCGLQLINNY